MNAHLALGLILLAAPAEPANAANPATAAPSPTPSPPPSPWQQYENMEISIVTRDGTHTRGRLLSFAGGEIVLVRELDRLALSIDESNVQTVIVHPRPEIDQPEIVDGRRKIATGALLISFGTAGLIIGTTLMAIEPLGFLHIYTWNLIPAAFILPAGVAALARGVEQRRTWQDHQRRKLSFSAAALPGTNGHWTARGGLTVRF